MYRLTILIIPEVFVALISACGGPQPGLGALTPSATMTSVPPPASTPTPGPTQTPTLTHTQTHTPAPTSTTTPTFTPLPTLFGGFSGGVVAYQEDWFGDIFTSSITGEQINNLTQDVSGQKWFISWSPDGSKIFYVVFQGQWITNKTGELWVMDFDGGNKTFLWGSTLPSLVIEWLANKKEFLTYCPDDASDNLKEICLVDLDGFDIHHTGNHSYFWPGIIPSPDQNAYAWLDYSDILHKPVLNIQPEDNGLVTTPVRSDYATILWLPAGQGLLYLQVSDPNSILFYVGLDGTLTQLKTIPSEVEMIAADPSGSKVLVQRFNRIGGNSIPAEHGIMNADGTDLIWLSNFALFHFTPDGNQIIAQNWDDGAVYWIDPQTGNATQTDWMNWTAYFMSAGGKWHLQPAEQ